MGSCYLVRADGTATGSVQQRREGAARGDRARVVGTDDLEVVEQPRADRRSPLRRLTREHAQQAREGVLHMTPGEVEVGDRKLSIHASGASAAARRTSSATAPSSRCSNCTCASPATAS